MNLERVIKVNDIVVRIKAPIKNGYLCQFYHMPLQVKFMGRGKGRVILRDQRSGKMRSFSAKV